MKDNKQDKSIKAFLRKELNEYVGEIGHMTAEEKKDLLEWVEDGNSVYSNPSHISSEDGYLMDYINARRFEIDRFEAMTSPGYEQALRDSKTMDFEDDEPF